MNPYIKILWFPVEIIPSNNAGKFVLSSKCFILHYLLLFSLYSKKKDLSLHQDPLRCCSVPCHLQLTPDQYTHPICNSSPNCQTKVRSIQLYRTYLYVVALPFHFTETNWPKNVPGWHPMCAQKKTVYVKMICQVCSLRWCAPQPHWMSLGWTGTLTAPQASSPYISARPH